MKEGVAPCGHTDYNKAVIHMKITEHIEVDPRIMHGKPVVAGTRIPVYVALDLLAGGLSTEQVLQEYPDLTSDDVRACLAYAAHLAKEEVGVLSNSHTVRKT